MSFFYYPNGKNFQLQGASPPDPHQGHCPWTPSVAFCGPRTPNFHFQSISLFPGLMSEVYCSYKTASLCFKSLDSSCPQYLSDLLHLYTPSRQLRSSSDTRLFRIPSVRTKTYGQRAFAYQAPSVWNELPHSLRHSPSLQSFKTNLKTHLFPQ